MASNAKAATTVDVLSLSKESTSTLAEGAACLTHTDYDQIVAPGGSGATKVLGVIRNAGGVVSGDRALVGVIGQFPALVAAGVTVTEGVEAIVADTNGTLKNWTNETNCSVVGVWMETRIVGGSASELVPLLVTGPRRLP